MKKMTVNMFACDVCGRSYDNEDECDACEKSHAFVEVRLVFDCLNEWWLFEIENKGRLLYKKDNGLKFKFEIDEISGTGFFIWSIVVPCKSSKDSSPVDTAKKLLISEARLWFDKMTGSKMDNDLKDELRQE